MPAESPVTLRPARPDDEPFLLAVYASTRGDLQQIPGWDDRRREALIAMQSRAQAADYRGRFPDSGYQIVLFEGTPVGRLFVHRGLGEIRLVDIALLPEYRGRGIGGGLIGAVLTEAAGAGKPVRLHVERSNPALRLYQRLDFATIGDQGVHFLMEWTPRPATRAPSAP